MSEAALGERILGIDPGLNVTGYGVLDIVASGPRLAEGGVIRSGNRRSLDSRLTELYDGICDVLESLKPTTVAIEKLYSHYQRPTTAILASGSAVAVAPSAAGSGWGNRSTIKSSNWVRPRFCSVLVRISLPRPSL